MAAGEDGEIDGVGLDILLLNACPHICLVVVSAQKTAVGHERHLLPQMPISILRILWRMNKTLSS